MASVVEIANMALMRVGAERIISLDDANERARAVKAAWPFSRRTVIRLHSWNPPTVRASLPALVDAPAWGFDKAYQIPSDCLRMLEVDTDYDWRVEGRTIVTDESAPLLVRYLKDEEDTEQFDPMLVEAMVLKLAVDVSERLTNSNTKKDLLLAEWQAMMAEAKRTDGEEQSPSEFEEDDWILARY